NVKERLEGARIKHWLNGNSLSLYDKGSVLRAECMIRDPGDFKVYRAVEGDPQGPKDWRPLRKGIADLHRRAEGRHAANHRYLEALTAVQEGTPLQQVVEPLCRPAAVPARHPQRPSAAAAEANAAAPMPPESAMGTVAAPSASTSPPPPAATAAGARRPRRVR